MSQPYRFRHADSGGSPLPTTARAMLPIRQHLNRLVALNRTQRAVLIEVAELAENGSHKAFTADNSYLIERIGGTVRTITRALTLLKELGLLHATGATKLRRLHTTARLRACYTGTEAEQFAAVEALNAALEIAQESNLSIDKNEMSIDNGGNVYRHSGYVSIDNGGSVYRHSGSPYKETTNNEQVTNSNLLASTQAELLAAQKKITELESQLEEVTHQRNQLRASLQAQRVGSAHQGGAPAAADTLHFISFAQSPYATPDGFAQLATALGYERAFAPFYAAQISQKAGQEEPRTLEGWQRYVKRWLHNDAEKGRLQTTDPNLQTSDHGTATSFAARPVSGQKPTGLGGQLARSLAERRAGQ